LAEVLIIAESVLTGAVVVAVAVTLAQDVLGSPVELLLIALITSNGFAAMREMPRGAEFHQCEGSHADMLGQRYIESYQKTLKTVLQQRNL
jgi:hypothetical protein